MVYDISISLNRVFVFQFANWVRFCAPGRDAVQKGFGVFWDFRETGQFPSQTTTSSSQLGGREIIIVDLCVTIFDAVFDPNLKWSDLLTTQLCCTSFGVACFELTRCCARGSRLRWRNSSQNAAQFEKASCFPCKYRRLHSLQSAIAEIQAKHVPFGTMHPCFADISSKRYCGD